MAAQDLGHAVAPRGVQLAPPRDLLRVVEARQRCSLTDRVHVERAPHLARRRDDVRRRCRPADAEPGEAVDLGERPQHHQATPLAEELEPVGVVGVVDVLEVRLVEDAEDVLRQLVEEREQLGSAVGRAGRVVRVADVDELRLRPDRGEQAVEIVGVVAE